MTPANIFGIVAALVVSIVIGYAITSSLLSRSLPRHFAWTFAPGVGLGLCSLVFFLFRRAMFSIEAVLLFVSIWLIFRRRQVPVPSAATRRVPSATFFLCGVMGLAFAALALRVDRLPHGDWDGFAIWNTHARFLFRDGANWKDDIRYSYHSDYPQLTPSLAARFWRYAGDEIPEAGAIPGIILSLSGVVILVSTLSRLRGASTGAVIAIVLLGTPFYLYHAVSQYADTVLSFFILSTIALICLYEHSSDDRVLALAGFTAGCAGWTKNEGMLFIAAACVAFLPPVVRMPSKLFHRLVAFFCGLILPLTVIIVFKSTILGRTDLLEYQANTVGKLLDLSRHSMIVKNYIAKSISFGSWTISPLIPLLMFTVVRGIDRRAIQAFGWATGATIVGIVLVGYYFIYVVTPLDLQVHLDSSLDRLFLHLWPSVLLLCGLLSKPDE